MKVAAIQMVSSADVQANLTRVKTLIARASEQAADLVLLPETFLTYGLKERLNQDAQMRIVAEIAALAQAYKCWIVAGTLPLSPQVLKEFSEDKIDDSQGEKPYAACLVFDTDGKVRESYLKIHLFDVDVQDSHKSYRESRDYCPGDTLKTFDLPWCRLGLSVCYDLRFPELYTGLAKKGAQLIVVPSAFTEVTGRAHWEVLLRARAIETQSYILAANQGGKHPNGRATWGESMLVNPWGEVVSKLALGEGVLVADLDFSLNERLQREMPVQEHRRLI